MRRLAEDSSRGGRGFRAVANAFLAQPGLPFVSLLSAERIERVFAKHGNLFGQGTIYSTALMVWSFLGQVLRDGKEAACQSAVARIVAHQAEVGGAVPTSDTGDYCRARAKRSEAALHDLSVEVAQEVESRADAKWLWKGTHAKRIDGFPVFPSPRNTAPCPTRPRIRPSTRSPHRRRRALASRSRARVRSSRWRRPA